MNTKDLFIYNDFSPYGMTVLSYPEFIKHSYIIAQSLQCLLDWTEILKHRIN